MRRLLPVLCFAVLAAGLAAAGPLQAPQAAVATRTAESPFPPVWALQRAPAAVSGASVVTAAIRAENEARWYAVAAWNEAVVSAEMLRVAERAQAHTTVRPLTPTRRTRRSSESAAVGSGTCGGDLPPCSVMMCESGGSLTAENPSSTASGKWQILDSTWHGYGGYAHAADAPESVQDGRAREVYAGGSGRGQWVC